MTERDDRVRDDRVTEVASRRLLNGSTIGFDERLLKHVWSC